VNGIENNKRFKIVWDTDLDGISSGTVMCRYLKHYTNNIENYINQGKVHGLDSQDINNFVDTDILIIVDSLDSDIKTYKEIAEKGIQIIILDHHNIKPYIPYDDYVTLVSSQREYENKALSGVGVTWKVCSYLDEYYGNDFANEYLDLVACGLVADMSDVSENSMENRYLISKGLENLKSIAIKKIVGSFPFNSTAIGFSIAPLINACNRVSRNQIAMDLFLEDDVKMMSKHIKKLKECKEEQANEVNEILNDIIQQAEKQINEKIIYIFIEAKNSISGLIGNKLLNKYQRPLLILKKSVIDDKKYYAGSARAVGVGNFNKLCKKTGLCQADGHDNAFGVKILVEELGEFDEKIKLLLENIEFKQPTIKVDMILNLSDINNDLINKLKEVNKISGSGFKAINVMINDITNYCISDMSNKKHLVIKPSDYFDIVKWNFQGSFEEMEENAMLDEPLSFIGVLDSGFIGRKFSLKLICDEIITRG
jgi:single-stranded-DNA-specific exonuclease